MITYHKGRIIKYHFKNKEYSTMQVKKINNIDPTFSVIPAFQKICSDYFQSH